jgi:uncharacterized protein involved in exopolysaccharide biosynthesis
MYKTSRVTAAAAAENPPTTEPSLWSFAVMLLRRPRLVFGLPLVFGALAGLVALVAPRDYVASASFVADDARPSQGSLGTQLGQLGVLLPQTSANVPQFYADLLQSRAVLRDAVTDAYVSSDGQFKGTLSQYLLGHAANTDEQIESSIDALRKRLAVTVDRVTGVVRFDVTMPDNAIALATAQRLLVLVNEHHLRRRQSQARAESEFLSQRRELARQDLESAEQVLAEFYKRNRSYANSPELAADEQRLQRQVSMRQQLYISLSQNYESSRMGELRDTPPLVVLETPDGFVELARRDIVRKVVLGILVGGFIALMAAFVAEYVSRAKESGDPEYERLRDLWVGYAGGTRTRLQRLLRRQAQK